MSQVRVSEADAKALLAIQARVKQAPLEERIAYLKQMLAHRREQGLSTGSVRTKIRKCLKQLEALK